MDFFDFYKKTIKTRVQKKLEEEEEEKKSPKKMSNVVPSFTINLDEDIPPPKVLTLPEPEPETQQTVEEDTPPRKAPKRRGAASVLNGFS